MVIRVSEIPAEGVQIDGPSAVPAPFADPSWRLESLTLDIQKDGEVVVVRGSLSARVPLTCGRCLEPFPVLVGRAVDARFVRNPHRRGEDRELRAGDLETDFYEGDLLDLGAFVETETSLELPMKPLCREDCRGLCPVCGENRNHTACACQDRLPDPRWELLRKLAQRTE